MDPPSAGSQGGADSGNPPVYGPPGSDTEAEGSDAEPAESSGSHTPINHTIPFNLTPQCHPEGWLFLYGQYRFLWSPSPDLRRLRRRTSCSDMHMPNTDLVRSVRDVVLSTLYPAGFRFMERRWNAREAMALFMSLGGGPLLRVGHLLDHRRSMGGRHTVSPRNPVATRGCLPLAHRTDFRTYLYPYASFYTFATHLGAPGGSADSTRATTIRVTAHSSIHWDRPSGVRTDGSSPHGAAIRYQAEHPDWFDEPIDYREEFLLPRASLEAAQWSSEVPITYIHLSLIKAQEHDHYYEQVAEGVGFPFDIVEFESLWPFPDVVTIDGAAADCVGVIHYVVLYFCDAYGEEVQYRKVLRNVPVVNFDISRGVDACLFCVGNDVLDNMGWSYNPHVNTNDLPSQQGRPWEPQRRPVPAQLQQGALQLTPRDRPGQVFLIPCGSVVKTTLPHDHITLQSNNVEEYEFQLGALICFTGAPYRPSSLSVLHNMRLFELLSLRPDMPFTTVTYSYDNPLINTEGEAMRLREQHQLIRPCSSIPRYTTHGVQVGWMEERQGRGPAVVVGAMPIAQGERPHSIWGSYPPDGSSPERLDFFGHDDLHSRALPGDADYVRPPPLYPCIEPPGPIAYAQEVAAAAQAQRDAPPPNYLA